MCVEAYTDFGLSLLNQIPLNESVVFSPLSLIMALSIVRIGTNGATKHQITNAICPYANDTVFIQQYKEMYDVFSTKTGNVDVEMSNQLFASEKLRVKGQYVKNIEKDYKGMAEGVNFSKRDFAAKTINDFTKEATNGKISRIISAGQIKEDYKALLTSAAYLNVSWRESFEEKNTVPGVFYGLNEDRLIYFMSAIGLFHSNYGSYDDFKVITVDMRDSYKFNIILPNGKRPYCTRGLEKLRAELTGAKLREIILVDSSSESVAIPRLVEIMIPKFRLESVLNLAAMLKKQGISNLFDDTKADFTEMSSTQLHLSGARQKAVLEVGEGDSQPADDTYTSHRFLSSYKSYGHSMAMLKADHPFLFFIVKDQKILFAGQYV